MSSELSVFDAEGRLRFHLYGTRRLESVEFVLGYGHALAGARVLRPRPGTLYTPVWTDRVFDLGTGRTLATRRLSSQPYLIYRGSPSVGEVPG
jgi:hypothetical protein